MDPLQALQAAYSVPADSKEQADLLTSLREHLETNPSFIPVLCSSLVRAVSGASDSLLKSWTLDLLHYGLSRANLPIEKRAERAYADLKCLDGRRSVSFSCDIFARCPGTNTQRFKSVDREDRHSMFWFRLSSSISISVSICKSVRNFTEGGRVLGARTGRCVPCGTLWRPVKQKCSTWSGNRRPALA